MCLYSPIAARLSLSPILEVAESLGYTFARASGGVPPVRRLGVVGTVVGTLVGVVVVGGGLSGSWRCTY